jgi:glycosyltransferase involved in cell wall biosynthesis
MTASVSAPLSLAFYSPGWPPDAFPNGIISYTASMRGGLEELGHRVRLFSGWLDADAEDGRVKALRPWDGASLIDRALGRLQPKTQDFRLMARAIAAAARSARERDGLDLMEMEESSGLADDVRQLSPVPVVVRLHGPWFLNGAFLGVPQDAVFHRRVRAEGRAFALADAITAPSLDVLKRTRTYYGLPLDKAQVVPNPSPVVAEAKRWRLDACDQSTILFIGRFDRHKGGDVIIDAFARLMSDFPRARLRFVGPDNGCIDDQGRRWGLQEYVASRLPTDQRSSRFEWLGLRPRSEIDSLRRQALVTVVPSRYENFPTTVLEAKALGCPLVASRIGGIPEIVRDQVDGLLCAPGDPADLTDKLAILLGDPNKAITIGANAALDAAERFHPVTVAKSMVAAYRNILENVR